MKNKKANILWTHFWDMHSGGGKKEKWSQIFIQAPEAEAIVIFYNRFGHNPHRVTCTCCGSDYSITEGATLEQLTAYHRGCKALETPRNKKGLCVKVRDKWFKEHYYLEAGEEEEAIKRGYTISNYSGHRAYQTIEQFSKDEDVLIIYDHQINPEHRVGEVPEQGYVWKN